MPNNQEEYDCQEEDRNTEAVLSLNFHRLGEGHNVVVRISVAFRCVREGEGRTGIQEAGVNF